MPRAIVNLVELLHILPLRDLHKDTSLGCPTWFVKWVIFLFTKQRNSYSHYLTVLLCFSLACPCILKPKDGSAELQKIKDLNKAYQVRAPAFLLRLHLIRNSDACTLSWDPACYGTADWLWTVWHAWELYCGAAALHEGRLPPHVSGESRHTRNIPLGSLKC